MISLLIAAVLVPAATAQDAVPADPPPRWWKGNIHTHTFWSDGDDFPEMVAEWYRTHDYNFLALSDHNVLSRGQRWLPYATIEKRGGPEALQKYQARFGGGWVETRGQPETPSYEVRLKPLDEFRALVEERGRFIMIEGEEISDSVAGKPVHMNATNLTDVIPPVGGETVSEAIANNLRAVQQQAERTGREILLHLNHPNFGYAVTAEDIAAVTAERFFEIYNGHPAINHMGDEKRPGVERIWDIVNTLRLEQYQAHVLFGVGTDDSHNYHGKPGSHTGRGWVMVRSRYLTPESLIRAMQAGDFYASSGVTLEDVVYDADAKRLQVRVQPESDATYTIQFIGSLKADDSASESVADRIGQVLATVEGRQASYTLTGRELYVRAVVTSSRPHPDPSFDNQHEQAWTQPVGW